MLLRAFSSWGKLFGIGAPSTEVKEERRAYGRILCEVETTCSRVVAESAERLSATVRNVSRGGINLVVAQPLLPGELLRIAVPGGDAEESSEVLACVTRCRTEKGIHQAACTFATQLSDADLMRFGGLKPPPVAIDQRGWVRFECPAQAVFTVVGAPDETAAPCPAKVLNISAGGIALRTPALRTVGELLSIDLGRGEDRAIVTTLASVVRTTVERGGEGIMGCNFISELSEEQVRRLL
jgi:hypothetical protein